MQELIDREQALKNICKYCAANEYCKDDDCMVYRGLRDTPTIQIEAEPVRHGRWIEKPPYSDETVKGLEFQIVCSRCDEQNSSITFDENSVPTAKTFYRTRFCPNCGADMREGGADI